MKKRVIPVLLALFCAVTTLVLPVTAASGANQGPSTLTLHYEDTEEALVMKGARFYLYRVGDYESGPSRNPYGEYNFTLTAPFEDSEIRVQGLNFWSNAGNGTGSAGQLAMLAEQFQEYISGKKLLDPPEEISPDAQNEVNSEGDVTFNNLRTGLYLVLGDPWYYHEGREDQVVYYPQPILIPLPYPSGWNSFNYDVTIEKVKFSTEPPKGLSELIDITVTKVWEGGGDHESVNVDLLCDGEVRSSVQLSGDTDPPWSYTWPNLNSGHEWTVRENPVPSGWKASVTQVGHEGNELEFVITNSPDETPPPPEPETPPPGSGNPPSGPGNPPSRPGTPPSEPGTPPSEPTPPDSPTEPDTPPDHPDEPGLPQTGQLWWPVPLLFVGGLAMFSAGVLLMRPEYRAVKFDEDGTGDE